MNRKTNYVQTKDKIKFVEKNKQRTQYEDKTKRKDDEHTQRFYLPRGGIAPKEGKAVLKPIVNFVECQLSIFGFVDCLKERESVMVPLQLHEF
jgi:hypothetical protein